MTSWLPSSVPALVFDNVVTLSSLNTQTAMGKTYRDTEKHGRKFVSDSAPPAPPKKSKYALKKEAQAKAPPTPEAMPQHGSEPLADPFRHQGEKRHFAPKGMTKEEHAEELRSTRVIKSTEFRGEGKIIYLDAIQNARGTALRIAEVSKGKRTIILIPTELVPQLEEGLGKVTPHLIK